jgi:mannose-1-phosphate guanylyltransferase
MDIGQPRDYITGLQLYLGSVRKNSAASLATGEHIIGNVLVHETAKIGEGCLIGPDVAVGPGCVVEDGVRLSRCTHQEVCLHIEQHHRMVLNRRAMGAH